MNIMKSEEEILAELLVQKTEENKTRELLLLVKDCESIKEAVEKIEALLNE